jgi:hypothetical protein
VRLIGSDVRVDAYPPRAAHPTRAEE